MVKLAKIKKLGVILRIVQILTIGASAGLVPLAIMSPWNEKSVRDYYSGFYYNLYIGLAYLIPVFYFLVIKISLKEYEKYSIRRSNARKLRHCIVCGLSNDYKVNFCTYCGSLF
jgi:hypothetical protein